MNLNRLSKIQDLLDEKVREHDTPGINCLIISHGQEIGYFEAGMMDIEAKIPVKRDTIFRLYSMSKTVTSAAVMILVENGTIDLYDDVSKYLPGFKDPAVSLSFGTKIKAFREVKIIDLLTMTSGLTYPGEDNEAQIAAGRLMDEIIDRMDGPSPLTTVEIANLTGRIPLSFQPGTHFQYGLSADVLGALVEVVSGKKFSDFLNENIFTPLGMKDTGFFVPSDKQNRLAKVYEGTPDKCILYTFPNLGISNSMLTPPAFESGGAGLNSTIDDMAAFYQMLLNNGKYKDTVILQPETVKYMTGYTLPDSYNKDLYSFMPYLTGYSYGMLLRVMTQAEHACTLGQNGEYGWDGWLGTYVANDPVNELTILMMQQRYNSGTIETTRKLRNLVYSCL